MTTTPPDRSRCPGCGLVLPAQPGAPTHAYMDASAECWALYGEVLAREYADPAWFGLHQMTVDAYGAQHPGDGRDRRAVQSLALHLITLGLFLEDRADPADGPAIHKRLVASPPAWTPLEPPEQIGGLTVADVRAAATLAEHEELVRRWSRDVWEAWSPHHATIRGWIEESRRPDSNRRPLHYE